MYGHRIRRVVIADDDLGALGGITSAIRHLSSGLRARGLQVEYLTRHPSVPGSGIEGPVMEMDRFLSMTALHPLAADYPGRWGLRIAVKRMLTGPWRVLRRVRVHHFMAGLGAGDAVISMKPTIGIAVARELERRRARRLPVPVHVHQFHYSFDHWYQGLWSEGVREIARTCDALVALWPRDAQAFGAQLHRTVLSIPNAIHLPADREPRIELAGRPGVILCASRLVADKRVDLAVRAFDRAAEHAPGWELHIVGDGDERPAVLETVAAARHSDRIRLDPPLSPERMQQALAAADLAVLTSVAEGLPMAILEAAAHGVPTIATRSAPSVEEVVGACGYLTEGDSPSVIADVLQEAMVDSQGRARRSEACRALAEEYAEERIAGIWVDLLEACGTNRPATGH